MSCFTQNSSGQSKNPIDSDHGIYRGENPAPGKDVHGEVDPTPGIRETLARSKPTTAALFDHLVSNGEESGRESETERLGGFQVYDQLD
jgi:hypothetical protein